MSKNIRIKNSTNVNNFMLLSPPIIPDVSGFIVRADSGNDFCREYPTV